MRLNPENYGRGNFEFLIDGGFIPIDFQARFKSIVEKICQLPGIGAETFILGISYKEDSTLARFAHKGFSRQGRLDPRRDLGVTA